MDFLYLFPDVHIWADKSSLLFFDTRNQNRKRFELNYLNKQMYNELSDVRNLYCIELGQNNRDEALLAEITREGFGVILQTSYEQRPIAIPPFHILKERFYIGGNRFFPRVMDYIKTITVHLGGDCKHKCPGCQYLYRQIHNCFSEKVCLTSEFIQALQYRINASNNLETINIICSSTDIELLQSSKIMQKEGVLTVYHLSWKNLSEDIIQSINSSGYSLVKIIIDLSCISDEQLDNICRLQKMYNDRIIIVFCVTGVKDEILLKQHINQTVKENIEIHYCYIGKDKEHIRQNYLLDYSDLQGLSADHNRIFGNRELNFTLFGRLVIHPDGTVRLNENTEVIGSVEDDWTDMLNKALNKPNPWLLTRNKTEPCSRCIFCDLCPPIRNLELYMGDKLACVDYYKSLAEPEKNNN